MGTRAWSAWSQWLGAPIMSLIFPTRSRPASKSRRTRSPSKLAKSVFVLGAVALCAGLALKFPSTVAGPENAKAGGAPVAALAVADPAKTSTDTNTGLNANANANVNTTPTVRVIPISKAASSAINRSGGVNRTGSSKRSSRAAQRIAAKRAAALAKKQGTQADAAPAKQARAAGSPSVNPVSPAVQPSANAERAASPEKAAQSRTRTQRSARTSRSERVRTSRTRRQAPRTEGVTAARRYQGRSRYYDERSPRGYGYRDDRAWGGGYGYGRRWDRERPIRRSDSWFPDF